MNTLLIKRKLTTLLIIASFLIAIFYPTSKNTEIFNPSQVSLYYLIVLIILSILFVFNKKNNTSLGISVFLIILLSLSTIVSINVINAELSIARIAPVILTLIVFSIQFQTNNIKQYFLFRLILEFVTIIIIITNILTLLNVPFAINFLISNYSQFNFYSVESSLNIGKPVFTFGVHSFTSLFYLLIFIMWFVTVRKQSKVTPRFILYLLFLLIFTFLLNSVSSIIFAIIMMFLLLLTIKKRTNRAIFVLLAFASFIIMIPQVAPSILELFRNSSHGFIPRYFSSNIFSTNFELIKRTILGIGFTIPRNYNVVYTDSGYIVYLTMGTIYMPILLYLLLWRFLKNNLKEYNVLLFLVIMVFEFAIPSVIYLKTILFLIFAVGYINSAINNKNILEEKYAIN